MSKWDKYSRNWEPSFKQRRVDRDVSKNKPKKKTYIVKPPSPRYDDWANSPMGVNWRVYMDEYYFHYYEYKSLTYDEMIELKLRGYTVETLKDD
jgi:hypothetical protein